MSIKNTILTIDELEKKIALAGKKHAEEVRKLRCLISDIQLKCQHPLSRHVGCPAGGPSEYFCEVCGKETTNNPYRK